MAVKGLELFASRLAGDQNAFILIGGAACDLWFSEMNLEFRATRDLDVVLVAERLTPGFIGRFHAFIRDGEYEIRNRSEGGPPVLYRFAKPAKNEFPSMIELFCRAEPGLNLAADQHIIPVRMENAPSLSAILLHTGYYDFLLQHCRATRGIMAADAAALIPFKARAWLDLTARKEAGARIKEEDIRKHRNDVFSLATTLPGQPGEPLPQDVATDLVAFLACHPQAHPDWPAILQAIRATVGGAIPPETLVAAIHIFFQLDINT